MLKAYLAYSSDDKSFVDRVASFLGRPTILYDRMYFQPGINLLDSIDEGLDKSRVLVFFASRNSIRSYYVNHEITEARWRTIKDDLAGVMTIIMDRDLRMDDMPQWMKRSLIKTITSPKLAASDIRKLLMEQEYETTIPFMGRENDSAEFSRKLITDPADKSNRIVILSGLDGIGRKTFLERALRDYLGLGVLFPPSSWRRQLP